MHIVGVIAEYNPFHNGHQHHLRETRRITGCDFVVCVMAGAFTQRGEPALLDKWARARMALKCGADLVLELPALFALRTADGFASGGVQLLGALGVVEGLSFGCETSNMRLLHEMADMLEEEPPEFKALLREKLDEGMSHARARGEALCALMDLPPETVNAPNTVLALEYIRANARLETPMRLLAVKRTSGYHSDQMHAFASAGAIRASVRAGGLDEAMAAMPPEAARVLKGEGAARLARPEGLDDLLLYRLRALEAEQIGRVPDIAEGLEMRIKSLSAQASGRADLLGRVKCKRYTMARLSRILSYALLGVDKSLFDLYQSPPYARVLGFRDRARPLLRELASVSEIPLVSDPVQIRDDKCFLIERRATDLWGLLTKDPLYRQAGRDLTERMLIEYE